VIGPAPDFTIVLLGPGESFTVATDSASTARVGQVGNLPGDGDLPASWTAIDVSSAATFSGDALSQSRFRVESVSGDGVSVSVIPNVT
jgi:hypothetical protein